MKYTTRKQGRIVYGGGGIMPDYFIPLDTTRYNKYHRDLAAKGSIINTCLRYIDSHREELANRYKEFDSFNRKFEITPELLQQLIENGKKAGVKYDEALYTDALPLLKVQMKALIARDLWEMNEYFRIMNEEDASVMKAVELLQKGKK